MYKLLICAILLSGCATNQHINTDERVMVTLDEAHHEQYAIKRGVNFYWVRYGRLVPIDKQVLSFRRL